MLAFERVSLAVIMYVRARAHAREQERGYFVLLVSECVLLLYAVDAGPVFV